MAQERVRQQHLKELEERDQDLDDLRSSMQKKVNEGRTFHTFIYYFL